MAKDKGILLSKKHGVNPSLVICFYCEEETGEIALYGKLKGDAEAPKHCFNSLEPCDKCKEKYKNDTLVVEFDKQHKQPTGRWIAVPKDNVIDEEMKNHQVVLAEPETFNYIIGEDESVC